MSNNPLKELKELYLEFPELQLVENEPEEKKEVDWAIIGGKADEILQKIKHRREKKKD